ncbi:MAG: hypothetical protein LBQ12_11785 [Deltaproteobacteria bacterium]|jgi:hypothetical protein|nr:hypothetical protein [Deltaproteobacteria bacterium]
MAKYALDDLAGKLFKADDRLLDGAVEGGDLVLEIKRARGASKAGREKEGTRKLALEACPTAAEPRQSEVAAVVAGRG